MEFHRRHITPFLFPRDREAFAKLAEEEALFEVFESTNEGETQVGLCYVTFGEEMDGKTERSEFGGVFVLPTAQELGLGSALGRVSIAAHYVLANPAGRMIAHVHEGNTGEDNPREVLRRLGFQQQGEETVTREMLGDKFPSSMQTNADGHIVGHLFVFDRAKLSEYADWFGKFQGTIQGRQGISKLEIEVPVIKKANAQLPALLRDIVAGK